MPSKAMPGLQRVAKADRSKAICQLRVELMHINPLIWRRLLVPYDIKLPKLHECLQMTMGWDDSHLHHFKVGEAVYGLPDPDWQGGEVLDEQRYRLAHLMDDTRREFLYEYDFGDRWEHRVVLEQFDAQSESMTYPICTAGQRACPPEDVGGVPGYEMLLEAIAGAGKEDEELLRWVGEVFDPEGFDLNRVNRALRRIRG